MIECRHHWTVTSECPKCLRLIVDDLQAQNEHLKQEIETLLAVAKGCHDYGGGFIGSEYKAFQAGIGTVNTALNAKHDSQREALRRMGSTQKRSS